MVVSAILGFLDPAGPVSAPYGIQQYVLNVLKINPFCPVFHWGSRIQFWLSSLGISH